jgi:hypothetical protein
MWNVCCGTSTSTPAGGRTAGLRSLGHLFVVVLFDVDRPHVVLLAVGYVLDGEERGEHRVVLVVVTVHAVAADRVHVRRILGEPFPDDVDVLLVLHVVVRVRLRHPHDEARSTWSASTRPRSASSWCRARSVLVGHAPVSSPSKTKYSRPRQVRPSLTRYGDHDAKFWIRPTFTSGAWM